MDDECMTSFRYPTSTAASKAESWRLWQETADKAIAIGWTSEQLRQFTPSDGASVKMIDELEWQLAKAAGVTCV